MSLHPLKRLWFYPPQTFLEDTEIHSALTVSKIGTLEF